MKEIAKKYYQAGYSCSESVVASAIEKGLVHESVLALATAFSGGMSSGCLCGAVAGSQLVISAINGRTKVSNGMKARELAKRFIEEFKQKHKVTCCKALTKGLEFGSKERKENCTGLVCDCAEILESMLCVEDSSQVNV